jgi:hypothetical protein
MPGGVLTGQGLALRRTFRDTSTMTAALVLLLVGTVIHIGLILFVLRIFVMAKDLPCQEGWDGTDGDPGDGGGFDPVDLRPPGPRPEGAKARLPEMVPFEVAGEVERPRVSTPT